MKTYVFDDSALVDLFQVDGPIFQLFQQADAGRVQLIFPAAAIEQANRQIQANESAWTPLLMANVEATALTEHIAIEISTWSGDVATRHVAYESQAVRARVVTREPDRYRTWTLPVVEL
jgi:hypothetical protein